MFLPLFFFFSLVVDVANIAAYLVLLLVELLLLSLVSSPLLPFATVTFFVVAIHISLIF